MKKLSFSAAAICFLLFTLAGAKAQTFSYGSVGSTYSQDFNTLTNSSTLPTAGGAVFSFNNPNGINATNMVGWYGEASSKTVYTVDTGLLTTGSFYSYGTSGSSDRALGMITTTTSGDMIFGLGLSNTTGQILTSFSINYNAEYWHNGTSTAAKTLAFGYVVGGGASLPTISTNGIVTPGSGSYIHDATLDYTQAGTGTTGPLDGHAGGNNINETGNYNNILWAPDTTLWLLWSFGTNNGQAPGLAIDNVTFSAVPEPAAYALFGLGALVLILISRRKNA